jgi:hypothetical protein
LACPAKPGKAEPQVTLKRKMSPNAHPVSDSVNLIIRLTGNFHSILLFSASAFYEVNQSFTLVPHSTLFSILTSYIKKQPKDKEAFGSYCEAWLPSAAETGAVQTFLLPRLYYQLNYMENPVFFILNFPLAPRPDS